jgi:acetyl esterase/lipase
MPLRGSRLVYSNSIVGLELSLVLVSYLTNSSLLDPEAVREFTIAAFNNFNPPESEDYLYLNVYAPSSVPPLGGYPIIFWIYGGSLQFGDAGQPSYDGSSFAAFEDVIVVTTNYRTNGMDLVFYTAIHSLIVV